MMFEAEEVEADQDSDQQAPAATDQKAKPGLKIVK